MVDLADVAGLLLELPECGVRRRLAEVEAAARQRPDVADARSSAGCGTAAPAPVVTHDRVGGDPDAVLASRCEQGAARNRGSSPRDAGTRSPITRPIVARTSGRVGESSRGVFERAGAGRGTTGRATRRRPSSRTGGASSGRRRRPHGRAVSDRPPTSMAWIATAASSVETSARWMPSPVNGSRKPAASPTRNQPGPARRVTRRAERRRRRRCVRTRSPPTSRPDRPRPGGSCGGHGRPSRPRRRGQRVAPRGAQHDPDVDAAARDRGEPDIAVADHNESGVAAAVIGRRGPGVGDVPGQSDPGREAGGPGDAGCAGDERMGAIRADDDPCARSARHASRSVAGPLGSSSTSVTADATPDRGTGGPGQLIEGRVQRRSVEADRRSGHPGRRRTSAGPWSPRGSRARIAGDRCRATASIASSPRPARASAATAAGDAKTPPARQCHAGARSRMSTSMPRRASAAPSVAPAGPAPTIATSTGSLTSPRYGARSAPPGGCRAHRSADRPAARPRRAAPSARPPCTPGGPTSGRRCG